MSLFLVLSFFLICFPFELAATKLASSPIAVLVGIENEDGKPSSMSSASSLFSGSHLTISQSHQDDIEAQGFLMPEAKKPTPINFNTTDSHLETDEEPVVRALYDLASSDSTGSASSALKVLAQQENCIARLAYSMLSLTGKIPNSESGLEGGLDNFEEAKKAFIIKYKSNKLLRREWTSRFPPFEESYQDRYYLYGLTENNKKA